MFSIDIDQRCDTSIVDDLAYITGESTSKTQRGLVRSEFKLWGKSVLTKSNPSIDRALLNTDLYSSIYVKKYGHEGEVKLTTLSQLQKKNLRS